jgi:hypothetical protein
MDFKKGDLVMRDLTQSMQSIINGNNELQKDLEDPAKLESVSRSLVRELECGELKKKGKACFIQGKDGELIGVCSRVVDGYGDGVQFNLIKLFEDYDSSYCLAWQYAKQGRLDLIKAYKLHSRGDLKSHWATPMQEKYFARTTLGKLKDYFGEYYLVSGQ